MARWVSGDTRKLGSDMMLVQNLDAGACRIELHLDPERQKTPFNTLPYINLLHGKPGSVPNRTRLNMKWISADKLSIEFPLYGSETILPTIHIDGQPPTTLTPLCQPYSPEFRPPQEGRGFETLRKLAKITGGTERGDISTIWQSLPAQKHMIEISHWLYLLAILTLLIDVLQRRTGIISTLNKPTIPKLTINLKKSPKPTQKKPTKHKTESQNLENIHKAPHQSTKAPEKEPNTISAMQKARQRARHRTKR